MERETIAIYDANAAAYEAARTPKRRDTAVAFGAAVPGGRPRLDLGCGGGRYTGDLGAPVVAFDASFEMLGLVRAKAPDALPVRGDLERLPFRAHALHGAWASMAHHHVPRERLPMALAQLHWALEVGAPLDLTVVHGDYAGTSLPDDDFPGRYFACWQPEELRAVVEGAGFYVDSARVDGDVVHVVARRALSLPDTVGPDMRLLVCGLNPSIYSAERGVGYARPGNRFWKAAIAAGLVSRPNDTIHALEHHGVGITDMVKRATVAAAELSVDDYRAGAERVAKLVRWLQPKAICFVGLAGYRVAVNRKAQPGWQPDSFGGQPAYVMPSTSGLNAATSLKSLTEHLRAAAQG